MTQLQEISSGIELLGNYGAKYLCAEHDEIHVGPACIHSMEDITRLKSWGWNPDSDHYWIKYV